LYFDEQIRHGVSSFSSIVNRFEAGQGLSELRKDIDSGKSTILLSLMKMISEIINTSSGKSQQATEYISNGCKSLTWKILRISQSQFLFGEFHAETRHRSYTYTLWCI